MELFVHIGPHKTATTYLQTDVFPFLEAVNFIDKSRYERAFFSDFLHADETVVRERREDLSRLVLDHCVEGQPNLVSNELFSGNPFFGYAGRQSCVRKLKELFPEAKVIAAIRGQCGLISSLYQEYVAGGGVKTVDQFVREGAPTRSSLLSKEPGLDPRSLKFGPWLDAIVDQFGQDRLFVFPFEAIKTDFEGFINDLGTFMEIDGLTPPATKDHGPRRVGLARGTLKLVRPLNHLFRSAFNSNGLFPYRWHPIQWMRHATLFQKRGDEPPFLPAELPDYSADNRSMDKRYHLSLEEKFHASYFTESKAKS